MRSHTIALLAAVLSAAPAIAQLQDHLSCAPAAVQKLRISGNHTRLRFRGQLTPPTGFSFDPVANGLYVELSFGPEADPANVLQAVSLPASGFQAKPSGVLYKDPTGAAGGITLVKIKTLKNGDMRILLGRGDGPLPNLHDGTIRLVFAAGAACVRTCPSPCALNTRGRLRCAPSTDTALCGVMSGCELLNIEDNQSAGGHCLLPYPSSAFEKADGSTVTGKRLNYLLRAMPANKDGVHVDTAAYTTLDGFSPGPIITADFPTGVDLAASNVPPLTNFAASVDPGSPTLLVEADSPGCVRVEHFGENDVSIGVDNVNPVAPPGQVFMIRPGRRLKNGTRYIVALRGLVDQGGQPIPASTAFRALRDGTPSGSAAVEERRPAMNVILGKLATDCGVATGSLVLAWDFTTASDDAIERYLLHMRDDTFAQLGSVAPAFVVTSVEDNPFPGDSPQRICRRVRGTYTVPLYTTFNGPGSVLNIDPMTNLPVQNGVATDVPFTAAIPCSLLSPTPHAGRPIFYGHGLLGSSNEVTASNLRTLADTYGFVMAATDWQGFSGADTPTVLAFISDLSGFRKLPERLHQGVLNQLVLAHLLIAPSGLSSAPAFQFDDGSGHMVSVIDTSDVFYDGNSQGGIEGGVVMALSTEATRGVLGVAAANYSTLLQRSVDFAPFFSALKTSYPNDLNRSMTYPLLQQLWDRSEPNGWYHHTVANPLPGTPLHKVIVYMATSDPEVANIGTEIMVRSMGFPQVSPVVKSYYLVPEMAAPFDGSAMVESDGHYGPVPTTNVPPASNGAHGALRALPAIQAQMDRFLRTGGDVENFCSGPCDPE